MSAMGGKRTFACFGNVGGRSGVLVAMPRFFFHITDGDRFPDEEGVVLADVPAALQAASMGAREIVAEEIKQGKPLSLGEHIKIQDESGCIVAVVTFRDALGLEGEPK